MKRFLKDKRAMYIVITNLLRYGKQKSIIGFID